MFVIFRCHEVISYFNAAGLLIISPVSMAPVCSVGDPLQLTCTSPDVEFISGSIFRVNEQGILEKAIKDKQINSQDQLQMSQPTVIELSTFTFTRTSAQGASPLNSMISIDSVNISLNGTVVRCSDVGNSITPASTTIRIIDVSKSKA